jgi:hypothetical protein
MQAFSQKVIHHGFLPASIFPKKLLMPEFTINDKRHLKAAEGWLELGLWQEANEELENHYLATQSTS